LADLWPGYNDRKEWATGDEKRYDDAHTNSVAGSCPAGGLDFSPLAGGLHCTYSRTCANPGSSPAGAGCLPSQHRYAYGVYANTHTNSDGVTSATPITDINGW